MAKTKENSLDKRRKQKRECEQRKRGRIRLDPQLYEEVKRKERERYHRRKTAGKIKTIDDLNEREKRLKRKHWRQTSLQYRRKKKNHEKLNNFLEEITPPSTPASLNDLYYNQHPANIPDLSRRSSAGRKRILRKRSETKAARYKTKYYRLKRQTNKTNKNSPRTKVAELTEGLNITRQVKRQLLFGEVLKTQLQHNFKALGYSAKKKKQFIKYTSGNLFKRYRLINETKNFLESHNMQKNAFTKTPSKVKTVRSELTKAVQDFYERDDNSRMCPGKKTQLQRINHSVSLDRFGLSYQQLLKEKLCRVYENMLLLVTEMKLLQIINESSPDDVCKTVCCDLQEKCLERTCKTCTDRQISPRIIHVNAHFGGSEPQVSMHTVVWYRKVDEGIKPESFCSFSESLRHDPAAIIAHLVPLVKTIKEKIPLLNRVNFCSAGPSTQYKNKIMFQLIGTKLAEILEVNKISWNYFESGHGKGSVDGIECVSEDQINNYDKVIPRNLKSFKGTMQVHQLCWNTNKKNCVALRRLSC
ncbi:hypothetical protein ILUMI_19631 [Ignelater luminosus]|uniref:Uncharacterized protein n=1 Tax=Ignelater luminosus TaxID=2038154 RepID=A0A8K0G313_IGNLU|nr:hypothetical protein ILUMI_19631 [Ignelater luminosus]